MTDMTEDNVARFPGTEQPAVIEPPHDSEVEAALLGAILTNNKAYFQVVNTITAEHFYEPAHRLIFQTCGAFIDGGRTASPLTLKAEIGASPLLAASGGGTYLYDLAANVVSVVSARDYALTIHDAHLKRQILALCAEHATGLTDAPWEQPMAARIEGMIEALTKMVDTEGGSASARSIGEAAEDALHEIDRTRAGDADPGIATGLVDVDRILNAMLPGELIIVAGATSMGKSALGLTIAHNVAATGTPVYFASLEMKDKQIARREMAAVSGVATENLRGYKAKNMDQSDFERLQRAAREAKDLPIWLDDLPGLTVQMAQRRAETVGRKAMAKHGKPLGLIIIDYLQLMQASRDAMAKRNETAEVTDISKSLKRLALNMGVPVLALSQLSREVEKRQNKRPQLSDLRQSGSIEQDADAVLFCYREEYYLERERARVDSSNHTEWNNFESRMEAAKDKAEIIIAKQRDGRTGTVEQYWNGAVQRFENFTKQTDIYGGDR